MKAAVSFVGARAMWWKYHTKLGLCREPSLGEYVDEKENLGDPNERKVDVAHC